MILDDIDKKAFNISSKILNFPTIEKLAEAMNSKDIKGENYDFYSSICYLLFIKRKEYSSNQRQLILKNIPLNLINNFFANSQSYSIFNNNNPLFSFSPSPSIPFTDKSINTLSMILNIIILCIQNDEDMKMFSETFGKEAINFFFDNMCYILQNSNNFRLNRKILGLFANCFIYNDELIARYFRDIEKSILIKNIGTNIVTKLQQIMKNKQKNYINIIVKDKNDVEEKIKKNDISAIDKICYIIRFLIFILSGPQGSYVFDRYDYLLLLKFFRELNITNTKIDELITRLKGIIKTKV